MLSFSIFLTEHVIFLLNLSLPRLIWGTSKADLGIQENYPSVTPIGRKGEVGGTLWRNLCVELFFGKEKEKQKEEGKEKQQSIFLKGVGKR